MSLLEEWLGDCRTQSTRHIYMTGMRLFLEWYQKPLETFLGLEPKDLRHVALRFQNEALNGWVPPWRKEKLSQNTVLAVLTALGSFCSHNDKVLRLRGKRAHILIDLSSHVFSTQDLVKMFGVARIEQKAILSTFCSLGWEVQALLQLKRAYVESLIYRAREQRQEYVYFIHQRGKTGAVRLGVLNPLAIEWVGEWLKTGWHGERLFSYTTKEGLNGMLKHLARDAHVTVTGRVHTHLLRKWVMSGLSRAGFNEFQIKFVVGKTIPLSDMTYLQTLQQEVEERYPKAFMEQLDISGRKVVAGLSNEDRELLAVLKDPDFRKGLLEYVKKKAGL